MGKRQLRPNRKPSVAHPRSAIVYLPTEALVADLTNPRIHAREQVSAIADSIEAFGFNAPILIDRTNRVIAGHGRLEAAEILRLAEVPVVRLDHLSEHQARAYMLADNKLTDRSTFDDQRVAIVPKELSEIALDFDVEATGFEAPEIELRIQSLDPPETDDAEDDVELTGGEPVSRLGDLWNLGRNRIYCGNALQRASYEALMGLEKAAAVFTDPPYNVRIDGHVGGKGHRKHQEFLLGPGR
jgi:hypothetical protein